MDVTVISACLALCSIICATRGTRELIIGYHSVLLHPLMVLWAWTKLYGLPSDPRIIMAIMVHDLGYFGCEDLDGATGNKHPELGGRIMDTLFGQPWGDFTRGHSAGYAKIAGIPLSRLYAADKLAGVLLPGYINTVLLMVTGSLTECREQSGAHTSSAHNARFRAGVMRKVATHRRNGWCELAQAPL